MNPTASTANVPALPRWSAWLLGGLLVLASVATVAGAIAGNGDLLFTLVPLLLFLILAGVWVAPIRVPLMMVLFLSLALDSVNEGPWNSPVAAFGSLLSANLNKSLPIEALAFPGVVLAYIMLIVVFVHRTIQGNRTDAVGRIPVPAISYQSLAVGFLSVVVLCAFGRLYGGDMQMAKIQVQTYVMVLIVAFLAAISFRGVRDYRTLGWMLVIAACIKALMAIYIVQTVPPPPDATGGKLGYATTHGDSMLFAAATVLMVVWFAEKPSRRTALICLGPGLLIAIGMLVNNRRLVWVEVAAGVLIYALMMRRSKLKIFMARMLIASIPLIILYIGVGWNSSHKIFGPVRTFRSVGDSNVDSSTMYRDLENFNLLQTLRAHSFTGIGFGHPFEETVVLPNISFFKEYRYMPHNSILGLWAFTGPFGFMGLMTPVVVALFLAARSYRFARTPEERIAATMVISLTLIYLVHCWGDIGFSERRGMFLMGPALAMAGQLALSTGAWRMLAVKNQPRIQQPS